MITISLLHLLFSNAASLRQDKSILYSRATITIFILSFLIALNISKTYLNEAVGLFNGLFYSTAITHNIQIFIFLISAIILQLTGFYPRKILNENGVTAINREKVYKDLAKNELVKITDIINIMGQQYKIIEYPLIILFITTGAIFLISSGDIVSIFLSIELQSYGLYLLATLYKNSELSTSAGLTYFLLGGLSSCFIVLGTSLLYTNSGTTNLDGYYVITSLSNMASTNDFFLNILDLYKPLYLNMSLLIMSVGFLFKISAAPFHFWSPDVYDAVPTIVTTFIAIIAKISILIFFLELVHYTSNSFLTLEFTWTNSLLISCLLSLIIGTILGLTQSRIKRLFAYSTISHLGFILLALSINSLESIQAFIFYLIQYSISNLNAFFILISIGYSLYEYTYNEKYTKEKTETEKYKRLVEKNNSPIQLVSQITGYFYINPILALSLAITFFSFIGIPPLLGFFAKQMVLTSALDSGYVFLAFVAILTSVISAAYYLNVINKILFFKCNYTLKEKKNNNYRFIVLSSYLTITVSVLTLIVLLFMFTAKESIDMAKILALLLFNP